MLPVVAIVGRPNVGKSTLFNRLTQSRDAIISDLPGTTRDRQFGEASLYDRRFIVIDTGGLTDDETTVESLINKQAELAIEEADQLLFVIDGKAGVMPQDRQIAERLRRLNKPFVLVVNKTESDPLLGTFDAYELGLGQPYAISAVHGRGIEELITAIVPETKADEPSSDIPKSIRLAIVGKPNVGKSTLTNRILGEERVIVDDSPGTTRDSIYIPLERMDQHYTIIDTAGVRRQSKIYEPTEKFSVVKTLQAIEASHVVLYLIDAKDGIAEQDLKLIGFALECGKALVIAVNKWDGLTVDEKKQVRSSLDRHLDFVQFARVHYISALHGSGVGDLFNSIQEAYQSATKKLSTSELTRLLQKAEERHSPPLVHGRRVKLRYAHAGGHLPPRIIIHGNQVDSLPESYRRYLANFFQQHLKLYGTPVKIEFKENINPYDKG